MVCRDESVSLVNPSVADEFYEVEIVNEPVHAWISYCRVYKNYVDDICDLIFETWTNCGNMENAVFNEELNVKDAISVTSYEEKVGISHELVCNLATIDDQEEDKVI